MTQRMQASAQHHPETEETPFRETELVALRGKVERLLDLVSEFHGVADRAIGIEPPRVLNEQSVLPKGVIGELAQNLNAVQDEMERVLSRLKSIA